MDDTVGGLEIKYVFNKEKREKPTPLLGSTSGTKEESQNIFTSRETQQLSSKSVPYKLKDELERKPQNKDIPRLLERNTNFTETDESHDRPLKKFKSDVEPGVARGFERMTDMPHQSMKPMADKGKMKVGIVPAERVENRKRNKRPTGSDILCHQPLKKLKPDGKEPPKEKHVELEVAHESKRSKEMSSKKSGIDSYLKNERKLPADVNGLKASGTCGTSGTAKEPKNSKILAKVTSDKLNWKNLKETRDDGSFKVPDNKMGTNTNVRDVAALSKGESKSGIALDMCGNNKNKDFNKEAYVVKSGESEKELSVNKSLKVSALATDKDKKNAYQKSVVKLRSNADSRRCLRRPWDDRLKNAYEQGTAILLHNVDPDFNSGEVEDIIWHVFREMCDAKIIQRTLASSPHYAQALILLRKKGAAQRILEKLDEECLMLSNGGQMFMPLVGTPCPPISTKKSSNFFGHLAINKARFQNKRADEAVSTSHFSQPNTIEYDMAMEWLFLYFKSMKWWEKFHEQHRFELENLKNDLKELVHEVS